MRRRAFITGLGGAAAWPLVARPQVPAMPVIGRINMGSASQPDGTGAAVLRGLNETGFLLGGNLLIEYRASDGQVDSSSPMPAAA